MTVAANWTELESIIARKAAERMHLAADDAYAYSFALGDTGKVDSAELRRAADEMNKAAEVLYRLSKED
jgi:hypothetical protein